MNATNLVYLKDAKGMTDSLTIAREFGKEHHNVIQKIRSCKGDLPPDFNALNFKAVDYVDSKGESRPKYELTRDGFMFLVMGFNGKKAAAVKILFIEEFNRMEAKLVDVGLQPKELTVTDLLRMTAVKLQDAVDYAADHAEEHGLTSIAIIKKYPEQSKKLIEETKPKIRNLIKYGPSGVLTVGLRHNGITSKIAKLTPKGPAALFNTKEVDDFMKGYEQC
jgi:Rha family phage regulatory protein